MSEKKDSLRERNLLHLFLALNVGLVAAFVAYLSISHNNASQVVPANFRALAQLKTNPPATLPAVLPPAVESVSNTTPVAAVPPGENHSPETDAGTLIATASSNSTAVSTERPRKPFTWREVESAAYQDYIASLRAVGCPEDKLRQIVLFDINALFDQKRIQEATAHDPQWWKAQPDPYGLPSALREKGRWLEEQRCSLIGRLLGPAAVPEEKERINPWSHQPLTGAILGAMPLEKHRQVQGICAEALDRRESAMLDQTGNAPAADPGELARLRERTRVSLRTVLSPLELEEFLLRYSHVAYDLRVELAGFNTTESEFRKIFRAIDPIEHQVQLEFGSVEAMSLQQRERHQRQRDQAIREAVGPERFSVYVLTKDPLFRQAQSFVVQFNAPTEAVLPIYQLTKTNEARRQKIDSNTGLTPEQRSQALNAVTVEQTESIQKIISDLATRRQ